MKLSVIMATYNETYEQLKETIESILTQTFSDFEFIIICDNPTNLEMHQWLQDFGETDRRIVLLFNETNIGLGLSVNRGIDIAKGEYIARTDADDISMPERFQKQLDYAKETGADLITTNRINIDEEGNVINYTAPLPPNHKVEKMLPVSCFITHASVLMKSDAVRELGAYRNIVPVEDYEFWLRFLSSGKKIMVLDEYLFKYRIRVNGVSKSDRLKQILLHEYVVSLYRQRVGSEQGKDDFSVENMELYLKKKGYFNEKYKKKANHHIYRFEKYVHCLRTKDIIGFTSAMSHLFMNKWARRTFFRTLQYKLFK